METELLMKILEFDERDLATNRTGYLSASQIDKFSPIAKPHYRIIFLFPFIFSVSFWSLFMLPLSPISEWIEMIKTILSCSVCFGIVLTPLSLIFIADQWDLTKLVARDLHTGKVEFRCGRGVFPKTQWDVYYWGGLKFTSMRDIDVYNVRLTTHAKAAEILSNGLFAVYFLPESQLIVSAERIYAPSLNINDKITHKF